MSALDLFCSFLDDEHVTYQRSADLKKTVEDNFDNFGESTLRGLITRALKERDSRKDTLSDNTSLTSALGEWGNIIDTVRDVTRERQDRASSNLRSLMAIAIDGSPPRVIQYLRELKNKNGIDRLFVEIVKDSMATCLKSGDTDNAAMFQFVLDVVDRLLPGFLAKIETQSTPIANSSEKASLSNEHNSNSSATDPAPKTELTEAEQVELMKVGQYVTELIKSSKSDASVLRTTLLTDLQTGSIEKSSLLRVLADNMVACKHMGYENKLKVLEFMAKIVDSYEDVVDTTNKEFGVGALGSSTYHAPKFVDEDSLHGWNIHAVAPEHFIEGDNTAINIMKSNVKNAKKKQEKRDLKQRVGSLADKLSSHLEERGWAVCDNFISLDLVRRIRIEAGLFTSHYEASEIWVGKKADVGAHLTVPSVRGDKVLWMCGAHQHAPEGITRAVRTIGEVEPCKLEIKAAAPVRKFAALKEIVNCVDKLVEELKPRSKSLEGIFERSDAMLSIYPGGGARFANHIDNTTEDGRRLTMVIYLNPEWENSLGGALRITEFPRETQHEDGSLRMEAKAIDVYPKAGRLALFYSSQIRHEVLPTFGDRHAITFWYYDRDERKRAVEKAREAGMASETAKASKESQIEAKEFMAELMGNDEIYKDRDVMPTEEEMKHLVARVRGLSNEAVKIVSSITGAPSVDSFRQGFELLTTEDLKSMRELFSRMGLNN